MTGKDYKECQNYLLALNIAATKKHIDYSLRVDYKFNKNKCSWIIRNTIYKWNFKKNKRLDRVYVNTIEDMIEYITKEMSLYE